MIYTIFSLLPKFEWLNLFRPVEIFYLIEKNNQRNVPLIKRINANITSAEINESSVSLSIAALGCPKYAGSSANNKRKEKDAIEPFRLGYISG